MAWAKENPVQRVRDRLSEQPVAPRVSNRPNVEQVDRTPQVTAPTFPPVKVPRAVHLGAVIRS